MNEAIKGPWEVYQNGSGYGVRTVNNSPTGRRVQMTIADFRHRAESEAVAKLLVKAHDVLPEATMALHDALYALNICMPISGTDLSWATYHKTKEVITEALAQLEMK